MYTTICAHDIKPGNVVLAPNGEQLTVECVVLSIDSVILSGMSGGEFIFCGTDYHSDVEKWDS